MKKLVLEETKVIIEKFIVKMKHLLKWTMISLVMGVIAGILGTAFYHGIAWATRTRESQPLIILGLPIAGMVIVGLYHLARRDKDKGTNTVIEAVRTEEEIPITVAPLIFVSTILTHLFGGSSGREGGALQMGGSLGNWFGKLLKLDTKDTTIVIMCGMSAAFAAVFGTPMAAVFFSMEVVSVGVMYYAALVPCVFASLIAVNIAKLLQVHPEHFTILNMPEISALPAIKIIILAALCAGVSIVFCIFLSLVAKKQKEWFKNPYLRIAVSGVCVIVLTVLFQTTDYLGAGMDVIERSMEGMVRPEAFLLKMLFTAITLGAGYKGGEIVPTFFIGATFGCLFGQLLGISPSLCAAVGMIALFCGVTNSPITSLLISLELFGMEALPYFMIGVAVSYMLSGYYGLYRSQKIVYSKFKTEFVNTKTKKI